MGITIKLRLSRVYLATLLLLALPFVEATIGEDGLCSLLIFVPFTIGYVSKIQMRDTN
jgi:hypothetical protein